MEASQVQDDVVAKLVPQVRDEVAVCNRYLIPGIRWKKEHVVRNCIAALS